MKKSKKLLLLSIITVVLLSCLTFAVSAKVYTGNCGAEGDNITWSLDTETGILSIVGSGEMENIGNPDMYHKWKSYKDYIKEVEISGNITSIGDYVFYSYFGKIESVILPNTIKKIGKSAFLGTSIKSIYLPEGLQSIGGNAFAKCKELKSVSIPSSVVSIGVNAFSSSGLESLYIPETVTDFNLINIVNNCTSLKNLYINNEKYTSVDGVVYSKDLATILMYPDGRSGFDFLSTVTTIGQWAFGDSKNLGKITIPDNITAIEWCAFHSSSVSGELVIPDSVLSLGGCSFAECNNFKTVKLPNSNCSMGGQDFQDCYNLETAVIGNKMKEICFSTFSRCTNLKSVTIPTSVEEIDSSAFYMCSSLKDIYYAGTEEQWKKIKINKSSNEPLLNATIHYNCWDDHWSPSKQFPDGYNFYEDRYSFRNPADIISKDIYQDVYGYTKGRLVYNKYEKDESAHGLCYGMASTTASILEGLPKENDYVLNDYSLCDTISDIQPYSNIKRMGMTARDLIKYGYVTQFSNQANFKTSGAVSDCGTIYNAVERYVNEGGNPVILNMREFVYNETTNSWSQGNGHAVLAVGLIGRNGILIDDSNKDEIQTIYFEIDEKGEFTGCWAYNGYSWTNGDNEKSLSELASQGRAGCIGYFVDGILPSMVAEYNAQLTPEDSIDKFDEIDKEHNMLYISDERVNINTYSENSLVKVMKPSQSIEGKFVYEKDALYWVENEKTIELNNFNFDKTEIVFSGNESEVEVLVPDKSNIVMTVDDYCNSLMINTNKEEAIELTFTTTDVNGALIDMALSGVSSTTEITATQTDTGLLVTGISDGTVTLTKDDEVIATEEIKDAIGDIEITYDKDGEDEELDAEYHSHSYESAETKNATCKDKGTVTYTCSCGDTYTEEIEINPDNHIGETEIRSIKDSTCTEKGYTGDTYCLDCGEKITEGKVTDIKGHKDADRNYSCDECGATLENNCSHMCHKTGFMGFIWKILRIFFKLFGSQPVCSCGVAHY